MPDFDDFDFMRDRAEEAQWSTADHKPNPEAEARIAELEARLERERLRQQQAAHVADEYGPDRFMPREVDGGEQDAAAPYTPDTAQVRLTYTWAIAAEDVSAAEQQFDRWLAAHDAEVAAAALDEFANRWFRWIAADAPQIRGGASYRARAEAERIRREAGHP